MFVSCYKFLNRLLRIRLAERERVHRSKAVCFGLVQAEKQVSFAVRGRMDIIADILRNAKHGIKKTRIMYSCNLSFRQLRTYLEFLLKKNFLALSISSESRRLRIFRTTRKGDAFLKAYDNLQAVISS